MLGAAMLGRQTIPQVRKPAEQRDEQPARRTSIPTRIDSHRTGALSPGHPAIWRPTRRSASTRRRKAGITSGIEVALMMKL